MPTTCLASVTVGSTAVGRRELLPQHGTTLPGRRTMSYLTALPSRSVRWTAHAVLPIRAGEALIHQNYMVTISRGGYGQRRASHAS